MPSSLQEYLTKIASGDIDPKETVLQCLQNIRDKNAELFPFLRLHEKFIEQHLDEIIQ
ncbi:MAG: hypothetical protein LBG52_03930 [Candidatus Peribacteria bacterium]|jgi:hypothetical protein|nr:hypothetical protein [Candidatus Peribacteria bacterium]